MSDLKKIIAQMKQAPANVWFADLCKVCEYYFGKARQESTSHKVFKTPWQGDPRVNIQNSKGKAKAYQVGQVLKAIEKLEGQNNVER